MHQEQNTKGKDVSDWYASTFSYTQDLAVSVPMRRPRRRGEEYVCEC